MATGAARSQSKAKKSDDFSQQIINNHHDDTIASNSSSTLISTNTNTTAAAKKVMMNGVSSAAEGLPVKTHQAAVKEMTDDPSSYIVTGTWIISNVITSVGIILVNKMIMNKYQFRYVFSLTALHFFITGIGSEILCRLGHFQRKSLPLYDTITMAIFCIGSVGFMNFSLQYNSVGFYQVCKLLTIPCMVAIQQYVLQTQTFTRKIRLTLLLILLGVATATVTDVQLNTTGSIMGLCAVLFTTQFQIWQGDKQKKFQLNAMQINHTTAIPSALFCTLLALIFETHGTNGVQNYQLTTQSITWIAISALLAFTVNLCSYGLIGNTSPVTYQVVGHAKTCLVLTGGFIMYPVNDSRQLMKNLVGIAIAMIGVIVYSEVKMKESKTPKQPDTYDRILPKSWAKSLEVK